MSDVCSTCKTKRPKHARWFYLYPDIAPPRGGLVPIAIYCRDCVPLGVYVHSLTKPRTNHLTLVDKR